MLVFLNAISFFVFYIKHSNKKLFFNWKYIAKIANPNTRIMQNNSFWQL